MKSVKELQPEIILEGPHYLVVQKLHGWLTVPSRFQERDERPCLLRELRRIRPTVLPIHRLDEEVSGIVIFAKTEEFQRAANGWFEKRLVKKLYEAWTEGDVPKNPTPTWKNNLLRGKKRAYEHIHGKEAITDAVYRAYWDSPLGRILEWHFSPLTGRNHQLRFQSFLNGFSIIGDTKYGSHFELDGGSGIALRAIELDFSECSDRQKYELPDVIGIPGFNPKDFHLKKNSQAHESVR